MDQQNGGDGKEDNDLQGEDDLGGLHGCLHSPVLPACVLQLEAGQKRSLYRLRQGRLHVATMMVLRHENFSKQAKH